MGFRTIFTCPRCGKDFVTEGAVGEKIEGNRQVYMQIHGLAGPKASDKVYLCTECAIVFGELLARVANKFVTTRIDLVQTNGSSGRLQRLVANNVEETTVEDIVAEGKVLEATEPEAPQNSVLLGSWFCKTCGIPKSTDYTSYVGVKLQTVPSQTLRRLCVHPGEKALHLSVGTRWPWFGSIAQQEATRLRARQSLKKGGVIPYCTKCLTEGASADLVFTYSTGEVESGEYGAKRFAERVASGVLVLYK